MRRPTKKMSRSLLVVGTSAALLSFGGANAFACGTGVCAPNTNTSTQTATNSQILPIGLGVGVSAPLNLNIPLLGGGSAPVTQNSTSTVNSTSKNNEVNQVVNQDSGTPGQHGNTNTANQTSKNNQIAPIAITGSISAPINLNLPLGLLSPGSNGGTVNQENSSTVTGRSVNNESDQRMDQRVTGGSNSSNKGEQINVNNQLLPIALGLGISAPININAPIAVLSPDSNNGNVHQKNDSDVHTESLNNETEQTMRQRASSGASNDASQKAVSTQLLPIAAALGVAVPINVNAPIAVLSPGSNNGDVFQNGDSDVNVQSLNNDVDQNVNQEGSNAGSSNKASQSSKNSQILPIALGIGASAPVNARAPIAILAPDSNNGNVPLQKAEGDVNVTSTNNRVNQDVQQRATNGAQNDATQAAISQQILPVAAALGAAAPVNAIAPVALLDWGVNNGDRTQHTETTVNAESINNDVNQEATQAGGGTSTATLQSMSANAADSDVQSSPEQKPAATGVAAPINNPQLPVSVLGQTLQTLTSFLTNPLGLLKGFLGL
ncbi:MAG: hypothetical protein QOD86_2067 [Miltoncostaeaceae bacterium]|jgi:hypothetical protein|nr:hypothetical protein [Miltoncostaeaceae bacterium]